MPSADFLGTSSPAVPQETMLCAVSQTEPWQYVVAGARCLLWHAEIFADTCSYLRWDIHIPDMEAAQRFLPLEILPGETYKDAFYRCRVAEDRDRCNQIGTQSIRAGKSYEQEFRCRGADGFLRWLHEDIQVETVEPGKHWRAIGVCTDVTSRKRAEYETQEANARLRRAMSETHHRVKNSLQMVAALIEMQTEGDAPNITLADMQRIGQHIRALADIHDLLTQEAEAGDAGDMQTLSASATLGRLLPPIQAMLEGRRLLWEVANVRLPLRQITPLAVLVNELVNNAVKHGRGQIAVMLTEEDNHIRLEIADEGPGFPVRFDPTEDANTGLELITNLVRLDMRGEIAFLNRSQGGARVVARFPFTAS